MRPTKSAVSRTAEKKTSQGKVDNKKVQKAANSAQPSVAKKTKKSPSPRPRKTKTSKKVNTSQQFAHKSSLDLLDTFTHFTPYESKKPESYMNARQRTHFRRILEKWKQALLKKNEYTAQYIQMEETGLADMADKATREEAFSFGAGTRHREQKLMNRIDEALKEINNRQYGYCKNCGDDIGLQRLEVRPIAHFCFDCKTLVEVKERQESGE